MYRTSKPSIVVQSKVLPVSDVGSHDDVLTRHARAHPSIHTADIQPTPPTCTIVRKREGKEGKRERAREAARAPNKPD